MPGKRIYWLCGDVVERHLSLTIEDSKAPDRKRAVRQYHDCVGVCEGEACRETVRLTARRFGIMGQLEDTAVAG